MKNFMKYYEYPKLFVLALPVTIFFTTFFIVPMVQLAIVGGSSDTGLSSYFSILNKPRHFESMFATLILSITVTFTALIISTTAGLFLVRNIFPGRSVVLSILTFPLAFPGVVIGFLIIMLAGRQGLIGTITKALSGEKTVFAYSILGLFFNFQLNYLDIIINIVFTFFLYIIFANIFQIYQKFVRERTTNDWWWRY